jgi:hypothetical protein
VARDPHNDISLSAVGSRYGLVVWAPVQLDSSYNVLLQSGLPHFN